MNNGNSKFDRVFILGASSWIGKLIADEICKRFPDGVHGGTYFSNSVEYDESFDIYKTELLSDNLKIISNFKPTLIINLLRGEEVKDFVLHKDIVKYCKNNEVFYIYASSALALDGYENEPLIESLPSKSISEYGTFKGQCEQELLRAIPEQSLIIRFSSIQGYVAHKQTRNQRFLETISSGKSITVDLGICQNRLRDIWLVEIILTLAIDNQNGIFHLGTQDFSDEDVFLKNVAKGFGWPDGLVVTSAPKNINIALETVKLNQLYGDQFKYTEGECIKSLLEVPEFQKYKNSNGESLNENR